MFLWDVPAASRRLLLDSRPGGLPDPATPTGKPGVQDMAWVTSRGALLAVLLAPGALLLLDPRDGARVWAREWHGAALTCLTRDPLDQTHVCACGEEVGLSHGSQGKGRKLP